MGTVHVLEVPRLLRRAANNEKMFTYTFFDREVKRVEYVGQRLEVRKEELAAAKEKAQMEEVVNPDEVVDQASKEEEELEMGFRAMEIQFMEDMGLLATEEQKEEDAP